MPRTCVSDTHWPPSGLSLQCESAWVSRRLHTLEERMESWIRSRQDRRGIRLR